MPAPRSARRFLGIDPGPTQSGIVVLDPARGVLMARVVANAELLRLLSIARDLRPEDGIAVEWISSFGMAVGREVFETCLWAGRFVQASPYPDDVYLVPRAEVKLALCGSSRAKDTNIRQALIDLFPPSGSGSTPQIGTKKKPGPLYGVGTHAWSALAVAVVASWREAERDGRETPLYAAPLPIERVTTEAIPTPFERERQRDEERAQAERNEEARCP